jgi:hypothetical protein
MKLLIKEACLLAGPVQSTHCDVGDVVDCHNKDEALLLARLGRAQYLDRADDPTRGQLTATDADRAQVKQRAAALKIEREARELAAQAQSPGGLATVIAQAVAQSLRTLGVAPAPAGKA